MQDILGSSRAVKKFAARAPVFACVISYSATCEIPGLTVAGANPELVKYTSPADAEFLYWGRCRCISGVPATPDGKPTPALITRTALMSAKIPLFVVEAGTKIRPAVPAISLGVRHGGNITLEDAMEVGDVERALEYGQVIGKQFARMSDLVVVGESIPGGTTTALAVLSALGVDARFKVSSSMPENPHQLKNRVVDSALARAKIKPSAAALQVMEKVGDPMMPAVAGIAKGALAAGAKVMLAGGTQMAAVLALLKGLGTPLSSVCIGTTVYVARDRSSDLAALVRAISPVPVLACDLHLDKSDKPGLQAYAEGFVKEGVGAGGSSIAAIMKARGRLDGKKLLKAIEQEYEATIERRATRTTP